MRIEGTHQVDPTRPRAAASAASPEEARQLLNRIAGRERFREGDDAAVDEAIRRFQGSAGLPETGEVDGPTARALAREAERVTAARDVFGDADLAEHGAPASARPDMRACIELVPVILRGAELTADAAAQVADAVIARTDEIGRSGMPSTASSRREHGSEAAARAALSAEIVRLFDVNRWDELSGLENASFALFDASGQPTDRRSARPGDFVRIDLPGPSGYDWVRIEKATVTADGASLTVRPSHDPTEDPVRPEVTAHFFTREATNTFSVRRDGSATEARVEGRNECANTGVEAGSRASALRNRAIAEGAWGVQGDVPGVGRVNGMQQHQWDRFTEGLVAVGGGR